MKMLIKKALRQIRKIIQFYYYIRLIQTPVWPEIKKFIARTESGINYIHYAKYYILYKTIIDRKPDYVLELGSGISTLIIGFALRENKKGKLVSMEESKTYSESILKNIDSSYSIETHVEETTEDTYKDFSGTRFVSIPDYSYDIVFIDGPRSKTIDLDTFFILEKNPKAFVLIDNRKRTYNAFKTKYNSYFDHLTNIGYINIKK